MSFSFNIKVQKIIVILLVLCLLLGLPACGNDLKRIEVSMETEGQIADAGSVDGNFNTAKVGDYVLFGAYEQDNNVHNGKEAIEWLVLEVKEDRVLVVSKYILDCKRYNEDYTSVTWETSTLRKWLNDDFINSAFSDDERVLIPTVTVLADENPNYNTDPGNATNDRAFLLSITDVLKYRDVEIDNEDSAYLPITGEEVRPTEYAIACGIYVNDFGSHWWLRSTGMIQECAACVRPKGGIWDPGEHVDSGLGIRPALWISMNG